jgi:hypothetical protein
VKSLRLSLDVTVPVPSVADPGSGALLSIGSGIWNGEKNPDPGSEIQDENPWSYFRELVSFFGLKILKYFYVDPG